MKRLALFFVLAGLSLAGNAPSAAEPLGRFFFTPAQRAQLDAARSQKNRAALASDKPEETALTPEILTYSGSVRRSDGKSTVWLNDRTVHDHEAAAGIAIGRLRPDGALTLQVPQADRRVELKVGQSLEVVSGVIEEPYARRLTVPRPKPAPADKPAPATPSAEEKTVPPAKIAGKPPLESRVESALERLRSARKEQDGNGQDRP